MVMATSLGTDHSCIFIVNTIVAANQILSVRAAIKGCLTPCTAHIIQEDGSSSRAKIYKHIPRGGYCICKLNKKQACISYPAMSMISRLHDLPPVNIPSCLHTTRASVSSQSSSHTVPQLPLWQISTRPSYSFLPPTSRMSELLQTVVMEFNPTCLGKNYPSIKALDCCFKQ